MKTISHSNRNLRVYAITQTWNWIVYLITLRITVRDWGRGCYVIISLWTCYENYFTQRMKLTCLCNYTDMKLNCVPYYLTHSCPRLGKGLLCNYNSLNLLWKLFHTVTETYMFMHYTDMKLNCVSYYLTHNCPRLGRDCYVIITFLNLLWKLFHPANETYMFMQLHTWNWIVYLITLRKAVLD